jgi:hypothetical protein
LHLIRPRDNTTRVLREDGSLSGLKIEHWDGRVDGQVLRPRIVHIAIPESERRLLRELGGKHG